MSRWTSLSPLADGEAGDNETYGEGKGTKNAMEFYFFSAPVIGFVGQRRKGGWYSRLGGGLSHKPVKHLLLSFAGLFVSVDNLSCRFPFVIS